MTNSRYKPGNYAFQQERIRHETDEKDEHHRKTREMQQRHDSILSGSLERKATIQEYLVNRAWNEYKGYPVDPLPTGLTEQEFLNNFSPNDLFSAVHRYWMFKLNTSRRYASLKPYREDGCKLISVRQGKDGDGDDKVSELVCTFIQRTKDGKEFRGTNKWGQPALFSWYLNKIFAEGFSRACTEQWEDDKCRVDADPVFGEETGGADDIWKAAWAATDEYAHAPMKKKSRQGSGPLSDGGFWPLDPKKSEFVTSNYFNFKARHPVIAHMLEAGHSLKDAARSVGWDVRSLRYMLKGYRQKAQNMGMIGRDSGSVQFRKQPALKII